MDTGQVQSTSPAKEISLWTNVNISNLISAERLDSTRKQCYSKETLNDQFKLNFHCYEHTFENLFLFIFTYLPLFISRDQRRCALADCDPQKYLWSAKGLQIFRRRHIVRTLTNKANVLYLVPYHLSTDSITRPWMTFSGHFALNSVLRRYVRSSWSLPFEAWLLLNL